MEPAFTLSPWLFEMWLSNPLNITTNSSPTINMSPSQNFYVVLGVANDCTDEEIVRGYREQALKWHPDKNFGATDDELSHINARFKAINHAGSILKDPETRRQYDRNANSNPEVPTSAPPSMTRQEAMRLFASLFIHIMKVRYIKRGGSKIGIVKFLASVSLPLLLAFYGGESAAILGAAIGSLINDNGNGDVFEGLTPEQQLIFCTAAFKLMQDEE